MKREQLGSLSARVAGGSDGNGGGDGPVVVLLHGFGAPGDDLCAFASVIDVPREVRFVFPEAPIALEGMPGGARAWWEIDMMRLQMALARGLARDMLKEIPDGLSSARAAVKSLLDAVSTKMNPSHVALGGFSQGAMLSCDVALTTDAKLAGVVLFSAAYIAESEWAPKMALRKSLPVLQSHGTQDPILPFTGAIALTDALRSAGLSVEFHKFSGGHGIPPQIVERVGPWLRGLFSTPKVTSL